MFYKAFFLPCFFFCGEWGKQPLEALWLKLFIEINGCGFWCLQEQSHHMLVLLSKTHVLHAHPHLHTALLLAAALQQGRSWRRVGVASKVLVWLSEKKGGTEAPGGNPSPGEAAGRKGAPTRMLQVLWPPGPGWWYPLWGCSSILPCLPGLA